MFTMFVALVAAPPLWLTNHTSQVLSIEARMLDDATPLIATGSQYTDDPSASSLHAKTGQPFWSSAALGEWTYGVALQLAPAKGLAAFGCPFDPEQAPVAPCEVGFWPDATKNTLAWKRAIPGAEVSASHGPPFVGFSSDGQSIVVTFIDRNSTSSPGAEFIAVVPLQEGGKITSALLGAGLGHGLHIALGNASTSRALLSRQGSTGQAHFPVQWGPTGAITVGSTAAIDCNGTAACGWLAASDDFSTVVVEAAVVATGARTACTVQPKDPNRWGFALLRGGAGEPNWPLKYKTAWAQCSDATNGKSLTSLQLVGSRVIASFAHVPTGTTSAVAFEACAYAADSGAQLWCTMRKIDPPAANGIQRIVSAHDGERAVFGVAGLGIAALDAGAEASPQIDLVYGTGAAADCCPATALAAVGGVAVASIPYGTKSGIWCNCQHSKSVGIAIGVA
jgi:hypothetical protein